MTTLPVQKPQDAACHTAKPVARSAVNSVSADFSCIIALICLNFKSENCQCCLNEFHLQRGWKCLLFLQSLSFGN